MLARVSPGLMNAPLWFTAARIVAIPPLMVLILVDDDLPGGGGGPSASSWRPA